MSSSHTNVSLLVGPIRKQDEAVVNSLFRELKMGLYNTFH